MQLMANACDMPVQLPYSSSASVVLGAAMLGAAAHQATTSSPISTQDEAETRGADMKDRVWDIMVRFRPFTMLLVC